MGSGKGQAGGKVAALYGDSGAVIGPNSGNGAVRRNFALPVWFPDMVPKWGLSVALTIGDIFFECFFRIRAVPEVGVDV
ncbi:MAG: hypothetical protein KF769_06075 [Parvibaculum sp.]|nr:hypothetical protein [Parvibaculum sp.]